MENPFAAPAPKAPEREAYRDRLAEALRAAKDYDGTETSYDKLFQTLGGYEEWLKANASASGKRLNEEEETLLLKEHHPKHQDRTISDLLALADRRFQERLQRSFEEGAELEGLHHVELQGMILPPAEDGPRILPGPGEPFREGETYPRLQELVALLNRQKVYLEDLMWYTGKLRKDAVRGTSYSYVSIPRMDKGVLVCDQVGEATFVLQRSIPPQDVLSNSKKELQEKHPDTARIVYRSKEQWESELEKALFTARPEGGPTIGPKVDVQAREELRAYIQERFSAEEFMALTVKQLYALKLAGKGMRGLVTFFDANGGRSESFGSLRLKLAHAIYGDDPIVQRALEEQRHRSEIRAEMGEDREKWKQAFLEQFPTAEDLLRRTNIELRAVRIKGKGITSFGTAIVGRPVSPTHSFPDLAELVAAVYGEEDPAVAQALMKAKERRALEQEREALGKDPEKWREHIKRTYPGPSELIQAIVRDRTLKLAGKGLEAVATIMGCPGDPQSVMEDRIRLVHAVYGDVPFIDHALEEHRKRSEALSDMGEDREKWKQALVEQLPTAQSLLSLSEKERRAFRLKGKGLTYVAKMVNTPGEPVHRLQDLADLAAAVYGEDDPAVVRARQKAKERNDLERQRKEFGADPEKWRDAIREAYPTAERFLGMVARERAELKIRGTGIQKLASIFGSGGSPWQRYADHVRLAKAIYGADDPAVQAAEKKG